MNLPSAVAVASWATERTARGLGLLLKGVGHNLRGQVEVVPQKLDTVVGEVPVVVHPCECLPHILLGLEALHKLDDLEIRHIDLWMLRKVVVLLGIAHSLCSNQNEYELTQLNDLGFEIWRGLDSEPWKRYLEISRRFFSEMICNREIYRSEESEGFRG